MVSNYMVIKKEGYVNHIKWNRKNKTIDDTLMRH